VAGGLDERPARFHGGAHDGGEFDRFPPQLDLSASDARDFHQVVHQAHHVVDLPLHHGAHAVRGGVVPAGEPQDVQRVADRRERVPQFVGQDGEEFILATIVRPAWPRYVSSSCN
jgi:hypothetical protein